MQKANDILTPEQAGSIEIDREFKSRIKPLTSDERDQLEANIKREGCRDPIVTWDNVVVDGHHRLEICKRLGISFRRQAMHFETREEALVWIDENQLGRRNLTPQQRKLLVGRLYNKTKPAQGGTGANKTGPKVVPATSAKAIGKRVGMSASGVKRAAEFAKAVDADTELAARVTRGEKVATIKPIEAGNTQQADPAEVGGGDDIYEAVTALDRVWTATTQDARDQFIARFNPSPAIAELLRALIMRDAEKSQIVQIDLSAELAATPGEAVESPVASPLPEPATDESPLVAIARQIKASLNDLGLDLTAFSTVRCITGDVINQNKILNAGMFGNLLSCLRTGNTHAKELADQAAAHIGQMPHPEPARNEGVVADESTR